MFMMFIALPSPNARFIVTGLPHIPDIHYSSIIVGYITLTISNHHDSYWVYHMSIGGL